MLIVTGTHRELGRLVADELSRLGHQLHRVGPVETVTKELCCTLSASHVVHSDIYLSSARQRTAVDRNIAGARHLARISEHLSGRVVLLSSMIAGGPNALDRPHRSYRDGNPRGSIARSVLKAESILEQHVKTLDILRLAIPYGNGTTFNRIAELMRRTRVRPFPTELHLTFIHVSDIARAVSARINGPQQANFQGYVGDGVSRSAQQLINLVESSHPAGLRLPFSSSPFMWRLLSQSSSQLGGWFLFHHLVHGQTWTVCPNHAEDAFGFSSTVSWSESLATSLRGPTPSDSDGDL